MHLLIQMLVLSVQIHALDRVPVGRFQFAADGKRLLIEVLDDSVIHVEAGSDKGARDLSRPIYRTPYIDSARLDATFAGPAFLRASGNMLETSALRITIDERNLCADMYDKHKGRSLTRICPPHFTTQQRTILISKGSSTDIYGLGEEFLAKRLGDANGNWMGERRRPGGDYGNAMPGFHGGAAGNAQFPVMYAAGPDKTNYALFLDHVYRQDWDFTGDPWRVNTIGDEVRWFFIAGEDLPALRTRFMSLVGHPLVPPKKAFGLWVSEFGYDSWDELRDKLRTLRANHFPVDGFVLDLQWFGGVIWDSENSSMGKLEFDLKNFPDPARVISELAAKEGIGLITIEESYVARGLSEHALLESRGFLARESSGSNKAFLINENPWWGVGGMIDWTNPEAGRYWHNLKRQPLVDLGILGHWTDLGEPEMYRNASDLSKTPFYHGFPELGKHGQADIHNVFSNFWHESIYKSYLDNRVARRPWILARSGGPGIQRYGAGMWSGDIGSNFASLAAHLNVQMHMSFSGMDYFGADIGGWHRDGLKLEPGSRLDDLYTQWFANGAAFDVPVRPHVENVANGKETSPDRIGDLKSNLANIRLRYELSPYYYSLAHRAYLYGEPIEPPLVYYYQNAPTDRSDMDVRTMGHEKLIGRDLLFAVVARQGETARDVYLPPGEWFDYRKGDFILSRGTTLIGVPEYNARGEFQLPLYARSGAIIPVMAVDDKTMNITGMRSDGSRNDELRLRVFVGAPGSRSEFTIYEDDGWSTAYTRAETATTVVRQSVTGRTVEVKVEPTNGTYDGQPATRALVAEMVLRPGMAISRIAVNGRNLAPVRTADGLTRASHGYFRDRERRIVTIKAGVYPIRDKKTVSLTYSLVN